MKRLNNVFKEIISLENLRRAHYRARRGKAHYQGVKRVNADEENLLLQLQASLKQRTFTTSEYTTEVIQDSGKERLIHKLPYYPDRIVQHAIMAVIAPKLERSLIRDTFQSLQGRGTHDARKRLSKCLQKDDAQWAMKLDIEKYYPSINNFKLKQIVRKKIKCKDTLNLIDNIIDSTKGLPIGNYISQLLGNLYLSGLDWMIVQKLKPVGYFRYCDDLVLISKNRSALIEYQKEISSALSDLDLKLKGNPKVIITKISDCGVDFVGFLFRKSSIKLRKRITKSFRAKAKNPKNLNTLMAFKGFCQYSNSKMLWRSVEKTMPKLYSKYTRKPL